MAGEPGFLACSDMALLDGDVNPQTRLYVLEPLLTFKDQYRIPSVVSYRFSQKW